MKPGVSSVWCERALIEDRSESNVLIEMIDGRFSSITPGAAPGTAMQLAGFTLPGLANAHSHAFHRALRSRTQVERGSFWAWRDLMYQAAERLNPDNYYALARAVFGEMVLAGVTCVGEFHYIHHQADGRPYRECNEMGAVILAAATDAGIRITLLDTLYLHGGLDKNGYSRTEGPQRRFSDQTVDQWIERVNQLRQTGTQRIGAAVHSARAVAPAEMRAVAEWQAVTGSVVHAHISEQPLENEACVSFHGASPTAVFADAELLSQRFTAVHATHLQTTDISALADAGATVALCPTTERDLGDGIGPTQEFAESSIPMTLGSDSHAVIDLLEETRALELHERLRSHQRGIHSAGELLAMATVNGHRSLGWDDAGTISIGNRADLVTVDLTSVRTAGTSADLGVETCVFAATAADISDVYVDGERIVADHAHGKMNVTDELEAAIKGLFDDA